MTLRPSCVDKTWGKEVVERCFEGDTSGAVTD
jgi:hypothetical protein